MPIQSKSAPPMKTLLILMLTLALAACSMKPSDQEVESAIRARFKNAEMAPLVEVAAVVRKNGYSDQNGVYVVEVDTVFVFKKSLKELEELWMKEDERRPKTPEVKGASATVRIKSRNEMELLELKDAFGDFPAGFKYTRSDKVPFIKTEKGWQIKG
jgi:hypothetical protein